MFTYTSGNFTSAPVFQNFQEALEYVFVLSLNKRIILVIDEYPYVAKSYKGFASILQVLIDKYKDTSKLFLILCGSSMSFMEEQVLGYKSPLYGRRTASLRSSRLTFECRKCFRNFSKQDLVLIYGIVGGTPHYILQ